MGDDLTRAHVVWAYRVLLDREPENEDVILTKLRAHEGTKQLRTDLIASSEFRTGNPDLVPGRIRSSIIKELPGGLRLFLDLSDLAIAPNIIGGVFEPWELAFVQRVLEPGQIAVDVGAHVGLFAVNMAARVGPTGRVYAFEPLERNASLLERSIKENGFEGRLVLERCAVASEVGTGALTCESESINSGGAFLLNRGEDAPSGHVMTHVRTVSLDAYGFPDPVRLLKLDAEGAEPLVIEGAKEMIARDRPIILTEVHAAQLERVARCSVEEFIRHVEAQGYDCRTIREHDLGDTVTAADLPPIANVVFWPR